MDIRQLTALVTVAEAGSITKASRLLHLVQPSVTRQIRTLEDELGVELFVRTRQGMTPTPEGVVMVDRARRALRELDRARAEIRPRPEGLAGIVSVGILESALDVVAEPLAAAVAARHPGVELRLLTAYSGHLQEWLDEGDVDCSLLYNLTGTPQLSVSPLLEERLWAVAPADAGLRPEEPVTWERVLAEPLVLPVEGHGLRVMVDAALASAGLEAQVAVEVNAMRLQTTFVRAGYGWTVLPAVGVAEDVRAGRLSGAPVVEPEAVRSVVLGLRRGGRTPPPVEAVAAELVRVCQAAVTDGRWPGVSLLTAR